MAAGRQAGAGIVAKCLHPDPQVFDRQLGIQVCEPMQAVLIQTTHHEYVLLLVFLWKLLC